MQVGDVLWVVSPAGAGLVTEAVLGTQRVLADGKIKPYTEQGAHSPLATGSVVDGMLRLGTVSTLPG